MVAGKIPAGKKAILACKRQLKDLRRRKFDYYFDPDAAERVCEFIECMPHTKGRWLRQRKKLELEPWQSFIWTTVFGWLRKSDNLRRFREATVLVPRKNGKSPQAAAIGLYMLVEDGEAGAEVYCGAGTEKQAHEVFKPAKIMVEKTPELIEDYGIEAMAKVLSIPEDGSKFEPLIGNPGDGGSPSCAIVDEFHEHKNSDLFDTMDTGMGAREQPLMLVISTAGFNLGSPCYEHQREMEKILQGVQEDEERFAIIYDADDADDWSSWDTIVKANPNLGVSVSEDYLRGHLRQAIQSTAKQNKFKTKFLNLWVSAKQSFFNMTKFVKCGDKKLRITDFDSRDCYLIIDLATKSDFAAYVRLFPVFDAEDRLHYFVFPKFYLPEDTVENDKTRNYAKWMKSGFVTVTDGNEIDFCVIREDVKEDLGKFNCIECLYDPWRATQLAQELQKDGAPMVECRQTVQNMSEPMKEMEAAVDGGRFHYDGNDIMTWMASNVVAKLDAKDNYYPRKEGNRNQNKIDGIVACIMGIGRAITTEPSPDIDDFLFNPIIV